MIPANTGIKNDRAICVYVFVGKYLSRKATANLLTKHRHNNHRPFNF